MELTKHQPRECEAGHAPVTLTNILRSAVHFLLLGFASVSVRSAAQPSPASQHAQAHPVSGPGPVLAGGIPLDTSVLHARSAPFSTGRRNSPEPTADNPRPNLPLSGQYAYRLAPGIDTLLWRGLGSVASVSNRMDIEVSSELRGAPGRGAIADLAPVCDPLSVPELGLRIDPSRDLLLAGTFHAGSGFPDGTPEASVPDAGGFETTFLLDRGRTDPPITGPIDDRQVMQYHILPTRAVFLPGLRSAEMFVLGEGTNSLGRGLRLRYYVRREFVPYVGVLWIHRLGDVADIPRLDSGVARDLAVVFGVRLWF